MHVVRAVSPVVRGSVGPVARGFPSAVLVLCLLAAGCSYAPDSRARLTGEAKTVETAAGVTVRLGARQVLLADGALGLHYFPDETVALLERGPPIRLLVSAGDSSYLLEGTDLTNLQRASRVLVPGPAKSFDNGYAGTAGAYRDPDGRVFVFYHAEDHSEELPRQSPSYSAQPRMLAVSA